MRQKATTERASHTEENGRENAATLQLYSQQLLPLNKAERGRLNWRRLQTRSLIVQEVKPSQHPCGFSTVATAEKVKSDAMIAVYMMPCLVFLHSL